MHAKESKLVRGQPNYISLHDCTDFYFSEPPKEWESTALIYKSLLNFTRTAWKTSTWWLVQRENIYWSSLVTMTIQSIKPAKIHRKKKLNNYKYCHWDSWMLLGTLTPASSSLWISCECPNSRLFNMGSSRVRYTM